MARFSPFLVPVMLLLALLLAVMPLPAAAAGPAMDIQMLEHDAGKVREGEVIQHTFRLRNTGDADLKILRVKPG